MNSPPSGEASLRPEQGWHCAHLFYRFDRGALGRMKDEFLKDIV